jgi:hypothetical protein
MDMLGLRDCKKETLSKVSHVLLFLIMPLFVLKNLKNPQPGILNCKKNGFWNGF